MSNDPEYERQWVANMLAEMQRNIADLKEEHATIGYTIERMEKDAETNREILTYWGWPLPEDPSTIRGRACGGRQPERDRNVGCRGYPHNNHSRMGRPRDGERAMRKRTTRTPMPKVDVRLGRTVHPSAPERSDGIQVVWWEPMPGAASYDAWLFVGPNRVHVAAGVTSPFAFVDLPAGTYGFGIEALKEI